MTQPMMAPAPQYSMAPGLHPMYTTAPPSPQMAYVAYPHMQPAPPPAPPPPAMMVAAAHGYHYQQPMAYYQQPMAAAPVPTSAPAYSAMQSAPSPAAESVAASFAHLRVSTESVASPSLADMFRHVREGDHSFVAEQVDTGRLYVDTADDHGNTPLIAACIAGHKKVARALLRRGANVNAANLQGQTALHYCFALGHTELGDYLIAKGANDDAVNANGLSPYEGL